MTRKSVEGRILIHVLVKDAILDARVRRVEILTR